MKHRARKRFGQNFLTDEAVIRRICECIAPAPGQHLVEIGPGQAAITVPLLDSGARVTTVELDRDLAARLEQRFAGNDRFRVVQADALDTNFSELAAGQPWRLTGNLPYNISTPLIFHVLAQDHLPRDMHFMLQKEVVDRLGAGPGGKDYGRLGIMVQNLCSVYPLFDIGPDSFDPVPRVMSALVRLVPRATPLSGDVPPASLDAIVRKAFSSRRKTLRNSLSGLLSADAISECGIDPGVRAEQLSIEDFIALARLIS